MVKSIESAKEELRKLNLFQFATLPNYKGGLNIILKNMSEDEKFKSMIVAINSRKSYVLGLTNSQILCGSKPLIGSEKEMTFKLNNIESINFKSSLWLGSSFLIKTKDGIETKFSIEDKKEAEKLVNMASALL